MCSIIKKHDTNTCKSKKCVKKGECVPFADFVTKNVIVINLLRNGNNKFKLEGEEVKMHDEVFIVDSIIAPDHTDHYKWAYLQR